MLWLFFNLIIKFDITDSTSKFFHLQSSSSQLVRKFLYFCILVFNGLFISRVTSWSWRRCSWLRWKLLYFSSQFLILCLNFFKLFVVNGYSWILRFLFFLLFFFNIEFYDLIVTEIKIFSSLSIFSNSFHPTYHFFMNLFIFPHLFYLLEIFLVDIFFFLPEVIIAILLTIILQTSFCDSRFKKWNKRV